MSAMQLVSGLEAGRLMPMVSDDGPHPPKRWAEIATLEILIGEVKGEIPAHARPFGHKVEDIVLSGMHIALEAVKKVFDAKIDPEPGLQKSILKSADVITIAIIHAAKTTPFGNTVAESAARGHIPQVVGQRLTDTIHDHLQHWRQSAAEQVEA